jgi:hypothetical protein
LEWVNGCIIDHSFLLLSTPHRQSLTKRKEKEARKQGSKEARKKERKIKRKKERKRNLRRNRILINIDTEGESCLRRLRRLRRRRRRRRRPPLIFLLYSLCHFCIRIVYNNISIADKE